MSKSMVMIRNITGITPDEIESLMTLAGLGSSHLASNVPAEITRLQELRLQRSQLGDNEGKQKSDLDEQIRGILRKVETRDYLYNQIKSSTGNHVILHLDHDITPPENAQAYITAKLNTIPQYSHINLFYMGGGHGGGHAGKVDEETSGLKKASVMVLVATLQAKGMKTDAVLFGSCYSAAFSKQFRGVLTEKGVMLSDSVECGSQNNFLPAMRWVQHPDNHSFFSAEEIQQSKLSVRELQDKFQELTDGRVENELIHSYSQDIASLGSSATLQQLEEMTAKHPVIQQHIKNLEERSLFKEDIERLSVQICEYLTKYSLAHPMASIDEVYAELETQFPNDKKAIALFKAMSDNVYFDETVEDFLQNHADEKEYILTATPEALTLMGVGEVKMFQDKEELYKSVQAAMRVDMVTGRVISTKDSSRMLEFNNTTGKPNATCLDAFTLNKTVIELIKSEPGVAVTIEDDVSDFNDEKVMIDFNSHFSAALEASMAHAHEGFKHFKEEFEHLKESLHGMDGTPPISPYSSDQTDEPLPQAIKIY